MQVKKFEAKTMKDALELVKKHLGPEAIILSAKDNSRGFGLVGQRSVEVTAAISEETLRRKRLAESKLSQNLREKFEQVPARLQRNFIEKANKETTSVVKPLQKPQRYAEIMDDEITNSAGPEVDAAAAEARVRTAAQRAWQAMNEAAVVPPPPAPAVASVPQTRRAAEGPEIRDLKAEIIQLKKIIEGFQKVPQTFLTMHPGAELGISYELSPMFQKLIRAGVSTDNTVEMLKKAQATLPADQLKKQAFVDAWVARHLMDNTIIADSRSESRIHAFIGPAGQGKTSALVKLAGHMVICEKKKIAIVTSDVAKVGAAEQLRIYAQILNVPFAVVRQASDWVEIKSKLGQASHVLIDFPGMNLKSMQEIDYLRAMLPPKDSGVSIHYVQSVLSNDESAFETAARYQMIGFTDVIFTCLDEAAQHGLIYNFQKRFQVPLHSFGIGRQIPEDFEPATKERVVDLLFKLSKLRKDKVS
jgi:flagellar biosynthesis protein FlhF